MKHTKAFLISLASILIVSGIIYAAGDLQWTPGVGKTFHSTATQAPIQACAPTTTQSKVAAHKGFVNFTTTSLTCIDVEGITINGSVPTTVSYKARVGGFATGNETDYQMVSTNGSSGETFWIGPGVTKIGFANISSGTATTTFNAQKM